jgi:hypothetical protein
MPKASLNDKLHSLKACRKIVETEKGRGVIPEPLEYDEIMNLVPERKLITVDEIKACLAKKHQVDFTDGMATGIFVNLAANASKEREMLGSNDITPYWRTLKSKGELNEKYPGGVEGHRLLLEAEGHTVVQKGKRWFVEGYEDKLIVLK